MTRHRPVRSVMLAIGMRVSSEERTLTFFLDVTLVATDMGIMRFAIYGSVLRVKANLKIVIN